MIDKAVKIKEILDPIIDAPVTSFSISGTLIALPFTLDGLSVVMNIILAGVGITVGYYRIKYEKRQIKKLDKE